MENARDVTVKLHNRIGKYLQVHLYFALRWIMLSEVSFVSSEYYKQFQFIFLFFYLILSSSNKKGDGFFHVLDFGGGYKLFDGKLEKTQEILYKSRTS